MFTSVVIHVERGQNLVAALPPSLLLSGADRDGIVCLSVHAGLVSHLAWRLKPCLQH